MKKRFAGSAATLLLLAGVGIYLWQAAVEVEIAPPTKESTYAVVAAPSPLVAPSAPLSPTPPVEEAVEPIDVLEEGLRSIQERSPATTPGDTGELGAGSALEQNLPRRVGTQRFDSVSGRLPRMPYADEVDGAFFGELLRSPLERLLATLDRDPLVSEPFDGVEESEAREAPGSTTPPPMVDYYHHHAPSCPYLMRGLR